MRKQNAQSNYENEKLSLAQRNPRRVGEAASSACALGIFPHGKTWKGFDVFVARGGFIPFCLERSTSWLPRDQN